MSTVIKSGHTLDWVEARPEADVAELTLQLEALADQAEAIQPERPATSIERFRPFPTDALPDPIRGLARISHYHKRSW